MRILFVNKFLHPNGGSETYIFRLGEYLAAQGHEVQYFGMEHEGRCVGNRVGAYTSDMDFHGGSKLSKITYPLKTIYSAEARRKLRLVLDDFQPDVVHLNNFTYQLTPSIILEIVKWRRESGRDGAAAAQGSPGKTNDPGRPGDPESPTGFIPTRPEEISSDRQGKSTPSNVPADGRRPVSNGCCIVFTAHDYNLICPNHMLNNPNTGENCERCLGGHFVNCAKGRCIHGSFAKSAVGAAEGYYWKLRGTYRYIDVVICCSEFMKRKMDTNPLFAGKTIAMHNFVDRPTAATQESGVFAEKRKRYVLYFGRFSDEKGIKTLLQVCRELPQVHFLFAGKGPLEEEVNQCDNVTNVGFQSGEALRRLIRNAYISVYPSEWYENCPFSVMESQMYGTPVLGADIGGIPELIRPGETGELFRSGDARDLKAHIQKLWDAPETVARYREGCRDVRFDTVGEYCEKLLRIYCKSCEAIHLTH